MVALARSALLIAGLAALPAAHASCNPPSPPVGSGGAWFSAYQSWCRSCGGTPSVNASPARCDPGPNWGGRGSSGTGGSYTSPGQALGREIGTAAGGLLACALFNQCPGGSGLDAGSSDQARQQHRSTNEQQKALIARAEREEAATLAASQQQIQSALTGTGALQARDLSADLAPAEEAASRHLNRAVWLSRQAWRAETPQQAAELSNRAFDAAVGGIVDSDVPAPVVAAPVDGALEQEFRVLRERYFESRGRAYAKSEMWVELVDHKAKVTALRNDASRKRAALKDSGDEAARLRALEAEAAGAETQLERRAELARQDARQTQQPALDDAQKLRDFVDRGQDGSMFLKGYLHGAQCSASNPSLTCNALSGEARKRCVEDYQAGYRVGEKQKQEMLHQAALLGHQDKSAQRRHSAFTSAGAAGPCRISWIEAYTDGYQGHSPPAWR